MRILITSFTYAPQANGVAEVVGVQAEALARRGHQVTVATAHDPARGQAAASGNPRVVEFKVGHGPNPDESIGEDVARYQQYIREVDADVILCHCWQSWPTNLAIAAFAGNRARKVMFSHGFSVHRWVPRARPFWGLGQWWRARRYVRALPRMLNAFDHVVFLSPTVNHDRFFDHWTLERFGGPLWSAIPNGTWPEKFSAPGPDFRQLHGLGGAFLALYVALYGENKNQQGAVRTFLEAELDDAVLVLIGNELNSYARQAQALARRLSRPGRRARVVFLEKQSKEMIRSAYQAMDLFFMTSKQETQPLVLLDAMGSGKPFLSTPVGCVPELPGGLAVPLGREMMRHLKRLRADEALRSELGRRGREAVRTTYHWETVTDALDRLLRRVAE